MLRRFVALFIVLWCVGQTFASVCGCDTPRAVHSCCKRQVEANDYFSAKGCCETEQCASQKPAPAAAVVNQAATSNVETVAVVPPVKPAVFRVLFDSRLVNIATTSDRHNSRPRAPDLYVRHHAFLI